jgi:hypothetical protein
MTKERVVVKESDAFKGKANVKGRAAGRTFSVSNRPLLTATFSFVIPRVCNFIGFEKKLTLKTKGLGASKAAKNQ